MYAPLKTNFFPKLLVFIVILYSFSCKYRNDSKDINQQEVTAEELLRANQFLVGKDMDLIKAYVKRRDWDIEFSDTGLGYQIYEQGKGLQAEKGRIITMEYKLSLLDGRVCYSSEEGGPKTFRIGQGGVEAGLEEGVLMLRKGDKARFIMPPFLAHGLIGDQGRIPPRAVVIYEIEVLNISDN